MEKSGAEACLACFGATNIGCECPGPRDLYRDSLMQNICCDFMGGVAEAGFAAKLRNYPMNSHRPVYRSASWLFLLAGIASASLLFSGCQSQQVKVSALANPEKPAKEAISYRIGTNNPTLDEESLRFKEAAGFVKTALSGKGMYEAPNPETADMVVAIDYGIGEPRIRREERRRPIYITVPGRMHYERVEVGTDANGNPIYRTVVVQDPPITEYIGDQSYLVTVINYEKHLQLAARENKPSIEGQPAAALWRVDVTGEGESRDLRKNLPVLAAATIDYIGTDTKGEKTIRIKDDENSAVAFVKKGM